VNPRIANIGPRGRQQRFRWGLVALVIAIAVGALIFGLGVSRVWRLALFVPLWIAGLGLFQARDKT
jgi:hypothetical protein